jgi:acetyl-CoA carboxylase biotin carboxyl carrier protein
VKIEDIERLIRLVSENDLESFEMKSGGMEIRITRDGRKGVQAQVVPMSVPPATPAPGPEAVPVAVPADASAEPTAEELEEQEGVHVVRATMVGTYYRAPAPGTDPFVQVGQDIRKGQVICIIEAMKIMNEIESEVSGRVTRMFVEDAQMVEYGEPIMAVSLTG